MRVRAGDNLSHLVKAVYLNGVKNNHVIAVDTYLRWAEVYDVDSGDYKFSYEDYKIIEMHDVEIKIEWFEEPEESKISNSVGENILKQSPMNGMMGSSAYR